MFRKAGTSGMGNSGKPDIQLSLRKRKDTAGQASLEMNGTVICLLLSVVPLGYI